MKPQSRNLFDSVFLFGPTAVGKTAVLTEFFSRDFEVVNADSVQVYRHLNIGSAKASAEEQNKIRHHLIDILEPWEIFNTASFVSLADSAVSDITSRGKRPVLSGGTAFYFKNYLYGLSRAPASRPETRQAVASYIKEAGNRSAHEYLASVDPVSASRINVNDTYRISRALEVFKDSGKPLSSFEVPKTVRNDMNVLIIGLTASQDFLASRIRARVKAMFECGLVSEIASLQSMGASLAWQSINSIGYKEFFSHLDRGESLTSLDLNEIAEEISMNSLHYAKRQKTFFNSFENVHFFDISSTSYMQDLGSYISESMQL